MLDCELLADRGCGDTGQHVNGTKLDWTEYLGVAPRCFKYFILFQLLSP